MAPQFTLYGNVASITSDRVRLMLADQGFTDYEFVNLDFLKGEHKQPPHLERHPWARVPSITLPDGTHLYESRPICKYLSQTHNFPLLPHPKTSTPLEQALFDQAISAETCYFFPPAGRISYQKGLPLFGGQTDETAVEEARKEVSMHFGILEGVLVKQDGEFMGGKAWSLVDIFYVPVVQRLIDVGEGEAIFGEDGEGKGNVRVKNWWGRCLEREPVKRFVDEMLKFEDVKKRLEARKKREEEAAATAAEGNKL